MGLQGYYVKQISYQEAKAIIEEFHYSHSINGVMISFSFGVFSSDHILMGAACFGNLAMRNQFKRFLKYGASCSEKIMELRRLACWDNTPKNIESFLIGRSLRFLKKNTSLKVIISYADKEYGHKGTIYKASNWLKIEDVKGAKVIIDKDGKKYHDKSIRTKYNGVLKPFSKRLILQLQNGEATYASTKGKHTFIYKL